LKRRDFIKFIAGSAAGAATAVANPAPAQQPNKIYRIGYLAGNSISTGQQFFLQAMKEFGYLEGRDFVVEWRFAEWKYENLSDLALELVQSKVDVIVAVTGPAVVAAQDATTTVPIVMAVSVDPVQLGLVASLARPGHNTTGLSSMNDDIYSRQLELLHSLLPTLSRVGLLQNSTKLGPDNPYLHNIPKKLSLAAQKLGITIDQELVKYPDDLPKAFSSLYQRRIQALTMTSTPLLNTERVNIAKLALDYGLPSITQRREYAVAGGLMSYGESGWEFYRRAAYYVDKILKGAKPGDLPVEQPTRFQLVINLRVAKALGLTIPAHLLVTADELLE
jgi:putative tryptophan/tyrosine transport system substrate-binding protein